VSQAAVTVTPPPNHAGITVLATFKLIKGIVLILSAFGAFELRGHAMEDVLHWVVDHAHLAPEGRLVRWLSLRLDDLTDGRLKLISQIGFAYGAMQLFEAYGLFLRRRWAEWLVVIATTIPLPFEIYELAHTPTWMRAGILAFNAAIAAYLWHRRTDFLSAKQWAFLRRRGQA
jgi:uncharacterized membrane protein (DUF2068 family)